MISDGSAKPTDTSTGSPSGPTVINVSAITVTPNIMALIEGGATGTITETVNPSNATNKTVTWSSSNEAVATVVDGVVTPIAAGTANITVTTVADGTKTASCAVTVKSTDATIASTNYTVSAGGSATETITGVPIGTAKLDFLDALIKGNRDSTFVDANISDPVLTGDTLVVTAQDGTTVVTYTVIVDAAVEITAFDAIADVAAGTAGSATYADSAAVQAVLAVTVDANAGAVTVPVPVTAWVDTDGYDQDVAGSYTFTATLGAIPAGFANTGSFTATVEVIVVAVAAVATTPSAITLGVGSINPVGSVTNVAIPVAGGTDSTGAVQDWSFMNADRISFQ